MFNKLFGKGDGEQEATPAAPVATIDLALKFEPGFAVLEGVPGVRLRIARPDVEVLIGKGSAARKFQEAESPAHGGPFDQAAIDKTAKIAWLLGHGLELGQVARLFGEREPAVRAYYSWGINSPGWTGGGPASDARAKLAEGDRVRSTAGLAGGTVINSGRLVSALTGIPVEEKFVRLNASDVFRALRTAKDNLQDAAKALQVSVDDLSSWTEKNADLLAALR
jgi:hypothetical protein